MLMPVKIFCCYAHEDEALLNKLKTHLRPLQRQGLIDVWYDRDISAGTEWEQEIKQHLNTAQIILLLVSPDFMDSDYCYSIEMKRAIERHARGEATVIPVIVRPVYWHGEPLGKLQALPTDGKPVTSSDWHDPDRAWYDVTNGIYKVVMLLTSPPAFASPPVPGEIQQEIAKPSVITPTVRQVGNVSPYIKTSDSSKNFFISYNNADEEPHLPGRTGGPSNPLNTRTSPNGDKLEKPLHPQSTHQPPVAPQLRPRPNHRKLLPVFLCLVLLVCPVLLVGGTRVWNILHPPLPPSSITPTIAPVSHQSITLH